MIWIHLKGSVFTEIQQEGIIIKGCYTISGRPIHNSQEWGTYVVGKLTKMTTEKLNLLGFKALPECGMGVAYP